MLSPIGRPPKLTAELSEALCADARRGLYLEEVAALHGLAKTTLYKWLRQGAREHEGPYADFSHALKKAMAEADAKDLDRLSAAAAAGAWQAAAWRLERRNPRQYSLRVRQEVAAAQEQLLRAARKVLSATDFARVADALSDDDASLGSFGDASPFDELDELGADTETVGRA